MLQRDFIRRFAARRTRRQRRPDLSIADRKHPRSILPEVRQKPDLTSRAGLRRRGDRRLRLRRSDELGEARSAAQQDHRGERSVVRRSDISQATGPLEQSHRVDRARGLRKADGPQETRPRAQQFNVLETDPARTDGQHREAALRRKPRHLPVPRHGEHFFYPSRRGRCTIFLVRVQKF